VVEYPTANEEQKHMRTIVTTVGTSLLTNRNRPWEGWTRGQTFPTTDVVDQWLAGANPIEASAELHTWHRLGLFDPDGRGQVQVTLVHSHTDEGNYCGERLKAAALRQGIQAKVCRVDGLSYTDGASFNRALGRLARVVADEIKSGRARGTVELAATGGFKAEIAVANLVCAVLDTPVHYIYQEFGEIVTIEPLPVTLRPDWLTSGAGAHLLKLFSASADQVVPATQVVGLLKADERLRTLVVNETIDGQELCELTLLGEVAAKLLESPPSQWPPPTDLPPSAKNRLESAAHHRPRGWERVIKTLADSLYVTQIRYDRGATGGRTALRAAPDNESDLLYTLHDGTCSLGLRVSTTATTSTQRQLVQALLRRELGG
jgi:putative CRISPR-associated protein (TIGR02619 family)